MGTETPPTAKSKPEICQIRIMFPVETDEQAIEYKKKIADILSDKPDAQIHFAISSIPPSIANGPPIR